MDGIKDTSIIGMYKMYICITLLMCTPMRCSWSANLIYKIMIYREKEGMMLASVHDVTNKDQSSYTSNQKISTLLLSYSSRISYHAHNNNSCHLSIAISIYLDCLLYPMTNNKHTYETIAQNFFHIMWMNHNIMNSIK